MQAFLKWFSRITEFIAALLLAVIFITFLVQIFTRYAPNIAWLMPIPSLSEWMLTLKPVGWTVNLISLLWVYVVFWGSSFIVKERDHVTFDILYIATPPKIQRVLAFISSFIIIAIMVYSLPAIWDLVFQNRLMDLKKIQTLRMPITGDKIAIKWLFASFVLFMIATIIYYSWKLFMVSFGKQSTKTDENLIPAEKQEGDKA